MSASLSLWQRESWRAFWHQRAVAIPLSLAVVLLAATWGLVLSAPAPYANSLILRYSLYVGTNWLSEPSAFYVVPGVATFCLLVDVGCAYTLARRTLVLRYFWLWAAVAIELGWLWLALLLRQFNA